MSIRRILIVGDPHAHPRYDNDRFALAGSFARIREVDHVHCVGDWTDWPSLNMHKSMAEARKGSYKDDCEAGNDALVRFDEGLDGYPVTATITQGNHDAYPARWVAHKAPELEGKLRNEDVIFEDHLWKVLPFPQMHRTHGLSVAHYVSNPKSGAAVSTLHTAHTIVGRDDRTVVVGHQHTFDLKARTLNSGRTVYGLVAGCWTHPKYREAWCAGTVQNWRRGLVVLTMRGTRLLGFEWVEMEQVEREVGK